METQSPITPNPSQSPHLVRNVLVKGLLLFLAANLVFAVAQPLPALGRISAYNHLFPGRERLPYGDNPQRAYNLSLFQLEAMFASHEVTGKPKSPAEYRVLIIGNSSTWGFLLQPDQTLAAYLNAAGYRLSDGRLVRAYNLGYPVMSLTKDLLILSYAMRYEPDLILWPLTLESFPYDKQLYPPLLQHNPQAVRALIRTYDLRLDPNDPNLLDSSFWAQTLGGQRRALADMLRLQFYGVMWAATGVDQDIPDAYTPPMEDLPADLDFHDLKPPNMSESDLAFDVLRAGVRMAGGTPVLFINEPVFISQGQNSDIRYNFYYPRWAYDDYRNLMAAQSEINHWRYRDYWDAVPMTEFTNSAVHRSPAGEARFARLVGHEILNAAAGAP